MNTDYDALIIIAFAQGKGHDKDLGNVDSWGIKKQIKRERKKPLALTQSISQSSARCFSQHHVLDTVW
jgi:hypothetical protein